ncbi:MAG: DNA-directed RNA polymerase subunit alpha [Spirochaetes bacterium]|nr:DNA-directed RNA polymerase subunit alpha [Spirochaetota bacterium]
MALKDILESTKKPHRVTFEKEAMTKEYGKFVAQPFEKGYAVTIGNALRRALLSSIPGYAVSTIKIEGVSNEYENIKGVKEDTAMIILNLKRAVVRLTDGLDTKMVHIKKEGPGTFTTGDIAAADSSVEVFNKDHVIATLSEGGKIVMDLQIDSGYGYVPSEMNEQLVQEIGAVAIDAMYSPIRRVKLNVEDIRVGQRTDYGKLTLEVETNGTISPDKAVSWAAKILRNNLFAFLHIEEADDESGSEDGSQEESALDRLKDVHIEEVEFSIRTANFLNNNDLKTLDRVAMKTDSDLERMIGANEMIIQEIKEKLAEYNATLGMR